MKPGRSTVWLEPLPAWLSSLCLRVEILNSVLYKNRNIRSRTQILCPCRVVWVIELEKVVGCVQYQVLQLLEERVAYSIVGILALLLADFPDNLSDLIHVGSHDSSKYGSNQEQNVKNRNFPFRWVENFSESEILSRIIIFQGKLRHSLKLKIPTVNTLKPRCFSRHKAIDHLQFHANTASLSTVANRESGNLPLRGDVLWR